MFRRTTVALGLFLILLAAPQISSAYDVSSFFDVFTESAGPGYPAGSSVSIDVQNGSPLATTANASINLYDAYSGGVSTNKLAATLSAPATPVAVSSTTMTLTANAGFNVSSFFDVFCDITPYYNGGEVSKVELNFIAPDSFFDVFVECVDPSKGTNNIQQLNFHGALSDGLAFSSVNLSGIDYDTGTFHLQSAIDGNVAANQPVMTLKLTGSIVPEPSSMILAVIGAISLFFWAWRRGWSR